MITIKRQVMSDGNRYALYPASFVVCAGMVFTIEVFAAEGAGAEGAVGRDELLRALEAGCAGYRDATWGQGYWPP